MYVLFNNPPKSKGGTLLRKKPIFAYYYHLKAKTHVETVVVIERE